MPLFVINFKFILYGITFADKFYNLQVNCLRQYFLLNMNNFTFSHLLIC